VGNGRGSLSGSRGGGGTFPVRPIIDLLPIFRGPSEKSVALLPLGARSKNSAAAPRISAGLSFAGLAGLTGAFSGACRCRAPVERAKRISESRSGEGDVRHD
jgi:hypothetical protein